MIHKSCDSGWRQIRGLEINKEDWKTLSCVKILKQTYKTNQNSFPVRLHYHCLVKSYWLFQINFILTWSWSEILNSYKFTWSWGTSSFQRGKKLPQNCKAVTEKILLRLWKSILKPLFLVKVLRQVKLTKV